MLDIRHVIFGQGWGERDAESGSAQVERPSRAMKGGGRKAQAQELVLKSGQDEVRAVQSDEGFSFASGMTNSYLWTPTAFWFVIPSGLLFCDPEAAPP